MCSNNKNVHVTTGKNCMCVVLQNPICVCPVNWSISSVYTVFPLPLICYIRTKRDPT